MNTQEANTLKGTENPDQASFGSFVDYRRAVLDLTMDLNTLESLAEESGLVEAAQDIRVVLQRLKEERFSIAVVGEFNRGKSTLINALLGVHVAPMDVLACTAVLTQVTYALEKRAVIEFKDGREEVIEYDALPGFITKLTQESSTVAAGIARARVHYPSPYCLNNVDVIDTPGLNEDEAMTAVTLSVLPQADCAIMVIMAESPFGQYERDFLESRLLTADLGRVIFVVNGIDRLDSAEDVQRVVSGVKKRITDNVIERARRQWGDGSEEFQTYIRKIGEPLIFGLSARQAFRGKTQMNAELLEKSQFPRFESYLQNFLTEQRGIMMLQPPINRATTAARSLLEAMQSRDAALNMSAEEFDEKIRQADTLVQAATERWDKELETLQRTRDHVREAATAQGEPFISALKDAVTAEIAGMKITAEQLKQRKTLNAEVERAANQAVSRVMDPFNEKLSDIVAEILSDEEQRLRKTDQELSSLMTELRRLFADFEVPESASSGDSFAVGISIYTGFGGILSGYRSAGLKGAAVGLGASIGTAVLGGAALAVIGATLSFPIVLGIGLISWVVGGKLSDAVFEESRIERYKERATKSVLDSLYKHLNAQNVGERFADAATVIFEAFRKAAERGATVVINDARNHLTNLRVEHSRQDTVTEQQRAAWHAKRAEVEAILRRAQSLAEKLSRRSISEPAEGRA